MLQATFLHRNMIYWIISEACIRGLTIVTLFEESRQVSHITFIKLANFPIVIFPTYHISIKGNKSVPENTKSKVGNRYNQVPHLTQNAIWESVQNTRKHHTQENQKVVLFPPGDHKAARLRRDSIKRQT